MQQQGKPQGGQQGSGNKGKPQGGQGQSRRPSIVARGVVTNTSGGGGSKQASLPVVGGTIGISMDDIPHFDQQQQQQLFDEFSDQQQGGGNTTKPERRGKPQIQQLRKLLGRTGSKKSRTHGGNRGERELTTTRVTPIRRTSSRGGGVRIVRKTEVDKKRKSDSASGYYAVVGVRGTGWRARFRQNVGEGRCKHLSVRNDGGTTIFSTREEAARAYDEFVVKKFLQEPISSGKQEKTITLNFKPKQQVVKLLKDKNINVKIYSEQKRSSTQGGGGGGGGGGGDQMSVSSTKQQKQRA